MWTMLLQWKQTIQLSETHQIRTPTITISTTQASCLTPQEISSKTGNPSRLPVRKSPEQVTKKESSPAAISLAPTPDPYIITTPLLIGKAKGMMEMMQNLPGDEHSTDDGDEHSTDDDDDDHDDPYDHDENYQANGDHPDDVVPI